MQRIFIKKCFLFMMGGNCCVKRFTTGSRNCHVGGKYFTNDKEAEGAEVAETTVKRLLCCGFRRSGKAMGQLYQCCWRTC
jgi:hypothetical protein